MKKHLLLAALFCAALLPLYAQAADANAAEMREAADGAADRSEKMGGRSASDTVIAVKDAVVDYFNNGGTTSHLEPYSPFAIGIGLTRLGFGIASDFPISVADMLSTGDIPNKKKNGKLILDFDEILKSPPIKANGADIFFGFNWQDMLRLEFAGNEDSGLGLSFFGLTARFDLRMDEAIFKMLANGIKEGEAEYALSFSGAIFSETVTANWHSRKFIIPQLFVSASLAHYLPVIYIPKSTLGLKLTNKDTLEMGLKGDAHVYMPFNVFKMMDGEDPGKSDWGGIDFSIQAEYALFPIFDVGITVLNIPFIPAALNTSTTMRFDPAKNAFLKIDDLVNQSFDINPELNYERIDGEDTKWVVRPMRMDFYALYRPLRTDFLVLRPNIGFTVFNPSEEGYFNLGIETQLNVGRVFTLGWFTGGYDGLCRNRLGMDLHLGKIARIFLNLEMRSQDYFGAWSLKGAYVEIGMKWGSGFNGLTNF